MHIELFDHKLIFQFLNNLIIIDGLALGLLHKYFLKPLGLEPKILPIEKLLPKMIQPHLMKRIPLSPTDILVLTMIKVIVIELEDNEGREVGFCEGLEGDDVVLLDIDLFEKGTVEVGKGLDGIKVTLVDY